MLKWYILALFSLDMVWPGVRANDPSNGTHLIPQKQWKELEGKPY